MLISKSDKTISMKEVGIKICDDVYNNYRTSIGALYLPGSMIKEEIKESIEEEFYVNTNIVNG